METQEVALKAEKGLLVVNIPPEVEEQICSISDDDIKWLKISNGGFLDGDRFLTAEIQGVVFDVVPYFIRWFLAEPPDKVPFTSLKDQPENYELRVDLKLSLADGELVGLSMPPTSARSFSRYMKRLGCLRFPISEVVTVIRTKSVVNKAKQRYTVLTFDVIPPKTPKAAPENVSEPPDSFYDAEGEKVSLFAEDDIPF